MASDRVVRTRCVIAGGGPAGVVTGYLLARAGVDVIVVEKHADFFRDFRGDTIHPSTLDLLDELGLLRSFLAIAHARVEQVGIRFGEVSTPVADFRHVPGRVKYLAFMPQWDFLDFFVRAARRYPTFRLELETEVVDLIVERGRVSGVSTRTPQGALEIRADLVIGADGRGSTVRDRANLRVRDLGAPIDVLWMRVPRPSAPGEQSFGTVSAGAVLITIDRGDYFQCAFVIRKGAFEAIRGAGIEAFRARIAGLAPYLADQVHEIASWDDVKLLTVRVNRLRRWYRPGLLCIGDAAHAMSPVGGVGINLAIQDAVATANLLAAPLRRGAVKPNRLRKIQRRRALPARLTQALQITFHRKVIEPVLATSAAVPTPLAVRLAGRFPLLRRIPAYIVGVGFRPEHVGRFLLGRP